MNDRIEIENASLVIDQEKYNDKMMKGDHLINDDDDETNIEITGNCDGTTSENKDIRPNVKADSTPVVNYYYREIDNASLVMNFDQENDNVSEGDHLNSDEDITNINISEDFDGKTLEYKDVTPSDNVDLIENYPDLGISNDLEIAKGIKATNDATFVIGMDTPGSGGAELDSFLTSGDPEVRNDVFFGKSPEVSRAENEGFATPAPVTSALRKHRTYGEYLKKIITKNQFRFAFLTLS